MPVVHWLRVTRTCNNACVFCSEAAALDGVPVPLETLERELERIAAVGGVDPSDVEIRLSGGEPTLSPHLPAVVESAARRGFATVLVTNGRSLSKPGRIDQLVARGLTGVRISLHGATPAVHDAVVGTPGAFRQTVSALGLAARNGVRRTIAFVLTTENVGDLPALFDLAQQLSCDEVEVRDVLPTPDRRRSMELRVPDDAARRALSDAAEQARRTGIHLRTFGFERTSTNNRRAAFADPSRWPGAAPSAAGPVTPARVVISGQPRDPVIRDSTITRVQAGLEKRGVATTRAPASGPLKLVPGDLVLCTGFREVAELFEREPAAADFEVRVMDFHMLGDFDVFRSRWVSETRSATTTQWWPSERLAVISCFPGYAPLYAWYGVPAHALRVHPYVVDGADFGHHRRLCRTPYAFAGGNHLRDAETLASASALRKGGSPLPIHVYHQGAEGPAAPGIVYRGSVNLRPFYRVLAASRFVVIPLGRDPTRAAGITVAAMALAAGRAVVASATPAMRDHLDDGVNALLVEPEDPHALADAMDRLERDDALRLRLEQGAQEAARWSTGETFADVLLGRTPAGLLSRAP